MKKPVLLFIFWACSAAQQAQADEAARPVTAELSAERQQLSNGGPDWTEQSLRLNRALGPRQLVEASLVQASRFGLHDEQLAATYVHPLAAKLSATVDASLSSTHHFLPQHSLGLLLQYEFAPAWLVHGGIKNTRYSDASIDQATLAIERYVSSFSWAAVWRPVWALGTSTSSAELKGSYYYGDKNVVTFAVASGQEATQVNSSLVTLADVRSVSLSGRHWVSRDWAVTYVLNSARQGDYYTRNGLRLGVQYTF